MTLPCQLSTVHSFRAPARHDAATRSALPRRSVLALAVCAALGGAGPVWADCNGVASGTLVPNSGDIVNCTGTSSVSINNDAATGVTVNVAGGGDITTTPTFVPINLGAGATINNDGTVTGKDIGGKINRGAITIRGAGNRIVNGGTIEGLNSLAIQGNLPGDAATGTVLENSGVISTTNSSSSSASSTVSLGSGSRVVNSGQIRQGGFDSAQALLVGDGSRIENQAAGVIQAEQVLGGSGGGVNAVQMIGASTLVNVGTIRVIGDVSGTGKGSAVSANGDGARIENSGTIDAARGSRAIGGLGTTTIVNSGTVLGGADGAIAISNGEGSAVTLQTGSQITGTVSVRATETVLKTLADWGGNQQAFDRCQQNPVRGCYKIVTSLPQQATLALEGTGTEDDRITGFNLIEKRGSGAWTLGTSLQAGSASDDYQSGDFRGPLSVEVQDAAGQLNLTGAITDNSDGTQGEIAKGGAGTLVLAGNNTYTGATTINAGLLRANGGNAIGDKSAVTIAGGALLQLAASETIGSLAGAGDVLLQNNALTSGNDNTSTTFSGSMIGSGRFEKYGTGTLTLTGASTATGDLIVQEGALNMAGSTPMRATVSPAGTLTGIGTVGRLFNEGRVAPGNSIGTLTVTGDYVQASTGTLDIEIRPDGSANDLLAVGGSATLAGTLTAQGENGALLTPAAGGTQASPKLYTILTAGGGVSGQFGTTPAPLGAFTFNTIYNPDNVQLGVTYTGFTPIQTGTALTPGVTPGTTPAVIPGTGTTNQITKAIALDKVPVQTQPPTQPSTQPFTGFNSGNADFDRVLLEIANETADQLAATFNAIIAEPYAAFNTVLLEQNDFYAETVLDRAQVCSVRGRSSLGGDFLPERRTSDGTAIAGCGAAAGQRPHGAWLDATWLQGEVDGEDGLSGYDYRLAGAVLGGDTALSDDVAVGVAVGFGQPKLDSYDLADAEIDGDSWFVSGYGTVTRDRWEFAGLLGYTWGSYESTRRIRFGSIDRTAQGDFDGDGFIASAKAAYFHQVDGIDVVPEFGLTYSKIWQDGFTETGADSLNLKVEDADAHSLVTSIGVRVGTELQRGETRIRPQALLRYEYDWNADDDDNAHEVTSSFAAVPALGSIDIIGQNRGEHGLTAGAGATVQVADNVDLFAGAGYRWNSNGDEYSVGAGARMAW